MKHELLAPAASYSVCEAVIAAGADAVYLGGEKYSARAFAPNFSELDILRALDLAHLYGRRIYLAVNTLLKNREMGGELYHYIKPFYEQGLDAIIVQDYGVFQFVRKYFPDLPLHISTQMSVANSYGAEFLRERGAKRIIPARELSLEEIRNLRDRTGMEIECFVHGALCYCYSGQCLMSSMIGGRSGNRGRCAQPCRLPYHVQDETGESVGENADFPLSLKDLCTIDLIPRLCEAGVSAFKIEGRMKSLAYAAGVTQIYRNYLDLYEEDPGRYAVSEKDRRSLLSLGNRSGFTSGYYEMRSGRSMLTLTGSAHASGEADAVYEPLGLPKIPVRGNVKLRPGQPALLTVAAELTGGEKTFGGIESTGMESRVTGDTVLEAVNRPVQAEEVRMHIDRSKDTPFVFTDIGVEMTENCFVRVGQINELRRQALEQLKDSLLCRNRRTAADVPEFSTERKQGDSPDTANIPDAGSGKKQKSKPALNVTVCTTDQLEAALGCEFVDEISLDTDFLSAGSGRNGRFLMREYLSELEAYRQRIAGKGKRAGFCFPYVFRKETSDLFECGDWLDLCGRFDTLRVRSYDSLGFCLDRPGIRPEQIRLDFGLYVFSEEARQDFMAEGIGGFTASSELNAKELGHIDNRQAQLTVYGYQPVMVSAQCVYKNCGECIKKGGDGMQWDLVDRYGSRFLIKRYCADCYNVIYNSRPTYLLHRAEEVKSLGFGSLRIFFVSETREEASAVLEEYRRGFLLNEPVPAPGDEQHYTNGHFHRGVE